MKYFLVPLSAILGCGLMAGLFFAFSACIMKALSKLPPSEGIAAMKSINAVILNPMFFTVFFGTAAACGFSLVHSLLHWNMPNARYLFSGSLCYLAGVLLVTIAFNVPMNDALAAADPDSHETAGLWAVYLTKWTAWNHVRSVAALVATALFALALHTPTEA